MDQEIEFGRKGGLATVLLNRPKALNALTHEMCVELHARLKQWRADDSVQAVVVQGAGDRAFCAGGDIRRLYDEGRAGGQYPYDFYHDEYRLNVDIHYFPKPWIWLRGLHPGQPSCCDGTGDLRHAGDGDWPVPRRGWFLLSFPRTGARGDLAGADRRAAEGC